MSKRILILSANPEGTSALDLDTEKREIRQALKGSDFIIETRGAVRPADLQQALLEVKPQIVHFCGHGEGTDGIILVNDNGSIEFASTEALANLFNIFQDSIECIVFNACYSDVQATAISQSINYVVGMNRSILDESAIIFARGFYGGLAEKTEVDFAFKLGKNAIQLEYPDRATIQRKLEPMLGKGESLEVLPEHLIPVLKIKPNLTKIKTVELQPRKDRLRSLIGHAGSVEAIAFSNDDKYLVSGSKDCTVRLWEVATGRLLQLFKGHQAPIEFVEFRNNSKTIISVSIDKNANVWNTETGLRIREISSAKNKKKRGKNGLRAIAIDPNQKIIVSGNRRAKGKIALWNYENGEGMGELEVELTEIDALAINKKGKIFAAGNKRQKIKIACLDASSAKVEFEITNSELSEIKAIAVHEQILVTGEEERTIKVWDLANRATQPSKLLSGHSGSVLAVAINVDATMIASASADYTVKIWNLNTGELLETLVGHSGEVKTVAFGDRGRILASAGDDWEIKLWQL